MAVLAVYSESSQKVRINILMVENFVEAYIAISLLKLYTFQMLIFKTLIPKEYCILVSLWGRMGENIFKLRGVKA